MSSRRVFLRDGGLALVGLGFAPRLLARAEAASGPRHRLLVAIFQRGAVDGLNMVVPHGERAYYANRPTIAVPRPGGGDAVIDLDGFFGFHPRLRPLKPLYDRGQLAVIHACGSPDPTRSHLEAQDYMESGTPGVKSTGDGWLNRTLGACRVAQPSPFRAVALAPALPRALQGFEACDAVTLMKRADPSKYRPAPGADYPRSAFGRSLRQVAQLAKAGVGLEIAVAETGGWDHHVNEGSTQGLLAARLDDFARGLAALVTDLGGRMRDTLILTMSEFGRTLAENGSRGTDHGHGNAMLAIGAGVNGGRVHGKWPGLGREQLFEGRDLQVTTDFRDVFAEVVTAHLGVADPSPIFPGYTLKASNRRGFLAS